MIGDAVETDVAGGTVEGIDTIWVVKNGIHNDDIQMKGDGCMVTGCAAVVDKLSKSENTYAKGRLLSPGNSICKNIDF